MATVIPEPPDVGLAPTVPRSRARGAATGARAWLERHDGLVAFLAYLAVALIWYRAVVAHMGSNCACGLEPDPGDSADYVWWLGWFIHAIGHGLPLMHTTVIWAPTGINLAQTTASLLLAAVAAPLTLTWGAIPAYNVIMILAPVASGWAANRLCRHITRAAWPSLLAGATYGFSSFEVGHLIGPPEMVIMVGPPLLALLVIRLLDRSLSRRRFVACASVLLAAQVLLSVEVTFTMALAGALALLVAAVTGDPQQRRDLRRELPFIVLPWIIAGIATCWYTLQVLHAPAYATGAAYMYPTDLLSFLVPMPYTWLGGGAFQGLSSHFLGGPTETTAYLGWPLLLIVGHYLITARHTRTGRLVGILMGLLALWMLGPVLWANGSYVIELPYSLVAHWPLIGEALVGRIGVYLALVAAVVLATWLARAQRRRLVATAGVLAVLAVLPNLADPSDHNVGTWTRPRFFMTAMYTRHLHRGATILPIPWGYQTESYMWQARDDFYWKEASGYWLWRPSAAWRTPLTADLWLNSPGAGDGRRLRALIRQRRVTDVVVQNSDLRRWSPTLRDAGLRPTFAGGGVTVYRVPNALTSDSRQRDPS